ncbi:MAG TPA: hypothetical protein DDX54_00980 [Rhodospirillaceae bacterium]|jgi:hypothetical protein|nr:hypothetical protein [Alphaproteobacteria bacterium]HBH25967.1 hypothetical protein [Rhodospirillaceae bacterium]
MSRPAPDAPAAHVVAVPFINAEEAWFWFIQAQGARNDGARVVAGLGAVPRPCEPLDILKILERLWRNRMLLRDHLLVLKHYGDRMLPPDRHRVREARSATLWQQAMDRLEPIFLRRGIIAVPPDFCDDAQEQRARA